MNRLNVIQKFLRQQRLPKSNPRMTWSQAARAASLEFGNGYPMSPGMAQLIVQGMDPASEAFRTAYGLGPRRCPHCQQKIRAKKNNPARLLAAHQEWWKQQPKDKRDRIIYNAWAVEA